MSDKTPPADAASAAPSFDPPSHGRHDPAFPTTTGAAAARGGNRLTGPRVFSLNPASVAAVEGVSRYRGFTLVYYGDEPRRGRYNHLAVRDPWGGMLDLDVSRWNFHPNDDRFRWLVDNHFPTRAAFGLTTPLTDDVIDTAIMQQEAA